MLQSPVSFAHVHFISLVAFTLRFFFLIQHLLNRLFLVRSLGSPYCRQSNPLQLYYFLSLFFFFFICFWCLQFFLWKREFLGDLSETIRDQLLFMGFEDFEFAK